MNEKDGMARLVQVLAPGGRLVRSRRLRGGLGSRMHVLRLENISGERRSVVLRRYMGSWLKTNPERAVREYRVLGLLEAAGIAASRRVLLDAEGASFGVPAMVLSYLPGRSFFAPRDPVRWVDELARGIVEVHAVTPDRFDLSWLPVQTEASIRAEIEERRAQAETMDPLGREALEVLLAGVDALEWPEPRLIHDDYWPGNTVWLRGRFVAVIDWTDAKLGDYRADVSQCRADLVVSHGIEVADAFLAAYERRSGRYADMAFFDLLRGLRALVYFKQWLHGYLDAGMTHLTEEDVRHRLHAFVRRALGEVRGA